MNKSVWALILGFCSANAFAECKVNKNIIGASYSISEKIIQKEAEKQSEKQAAENYQNVNFWRKKSEVAFEHKRQRVTEIWNRLSNGKIRPVHYFDEYLHAIEYQPGEFGKGNNEKSWSSKYQIIPESLIARLEKVEQKGDGCEQVISYRLETKQVSIQLEWLPHYDLPKSYVIHKNGKSFQWQLESLELDETKVNAFFQSRQKYRTTDFADIGDNESDPFLVKMINLGFVSHGASGIYNAQGQNMPLEDGHRH